MRTHVWLRTAIGFAVVSVTAVRNAEAEVIINFEQIGNNVVVTASGRFDTSLEQSYDESDLFGGYIIPDGAFFGIGDQGSVVNYATKGAPKQFSSFPGFDYYSSTSGTSIGMNGGAEFIFLSSGYVSNSLVSSTALFTNASLESLGLNTAHYKFDAGGNIIRLNIERVTAAVPEPATWAMMLAGMGAIGSAMRRRPRASASDA